MSDLRGAFEFQAQACRKASPLYATLLDHVVARLGTGSVHDEVLAGHGEDRLGSALALRYLGAVHRLVLAGEAPALAAHYPSVGGDPGPSLLADFDEAVRTNVARLAAAVAEPVQTNEVGRAASLIGGLVEVTRRFGLPLSLLEVGASAGLLLRADHYRYETDDGAFGPVDSPVRLTGPWGATPPPLVPEPEIVARRGCDPSPIDPDSADGRLRLRGFLWPDQAERRARLDAALEVASRVPVAVDRADVADWLPPRLAEARSGVATVVQHSIVWQYLNPDSRQVFSASMEQAGAVATADRPLAWLRMEPGGDLAEIRLRTWPGGDDELVARSGYHGQAVAWCGKIRGTTRVATA